MFNAAYLLGCCMYSLYHRCGAELGLAVSGIWLHLSAERQVRVSAGAGTVQYLPDNRLLINAVLVPLPMDSKTFVDLL